MSDHDERLAALLSDGVSDVEPRDALDAIRDRTRVTHPSRRPWLFAVGGAVVATAAVITAIALATGPATPPRTTPGPATDVPTVTTSSHAPVETPTPGMQTVAGYYLGATPRGTRLFREFDRRAGMNPLSLALEGLQSAPADPDYHTPWPEGSFVDASFDGTGADGLIQVRLADASLHDRPADMTEDEAGLAIQQVVYTLQAAIQARAAVQFYLGHNPIDQVFGVSTSEALTNAPENDVLALVSITDPTEGAEISGSFVANGRANSFEANVPWQLKQGDTVVKSGFATADGTQGRLYPWQTEPIDVSDLPPGEYTFVAMTDDPSGGEGDGPDVDTRTVVVR